MAGDRLVQHFPTRDKVPAQAVNESPADTTRPLRVQQVKVGHRHPTADQALDEMPVIVVAPHRVDRDIERILAVKIPLKSAKQTMFLDRLDPSSRIEF